MEQNNDIVDADFEEVTEEPVIVQEDEVAVDTAAPAPKMGLDGFLKAVSAAVDSEQITTAQAKQLRQQMGIQNSYFTRNRNTDEKKVKAKRKAQKKARKTTRKKK